jgi:hypothetical protein
MLRSFHYITVLLFGTLTVSCNTPSRKSSHDRNIFIANQFVDAFYSFNRDSLASLLSAAGKSRPGILYYQKWAECGNYEILNRKNYVAQGDSLVIFPVTVKDDLMAALNIDFNVTDTFHISIENGMVTSVATSSNDLDVYYEAKEWVNQNRPDLVKEPCEGIWEKGTTPCECVQGMVKGFAEFIEEKNNAVRI